MAEYTIRLYATFKDKAGQKRITIEGPDSMTVADLVQRIEQEVPALAAGLPTAIVAVNREYAESDISIQPQDELALFPPVSGGILEEDDDGAHFIGETKFPVYFALSESQPDLQGIHNHLTRPDVGAIITFSGSVRGETDRNGLPNQTIALEYEAYEVMAIERMHQIADEIWEKWPLVKGIAIIQRLGKLSVGDPTTLVACAAGHRDQGAFEAARYGIDRLKEIVPVWKKEIDTNREVWVEGDYQPSSADNRSS